MNDECKKIFHDLVENAFRFLNKSVQEFETDIKYSIIHFCIALENILKAELMHEHWSLIFKKPENAKWSDFIDGNFQSVSLEEAINRLRNIARREIDETAKKYFSEIVKERNKIIHFYNENISKESIAKSQYHAWFYIDKYLRAWHHHFKNFTNNKKQFREIMAKQIGYLQIRYNTIKNDLINLSNKGYYLAQCPHCHYRALAISKPNKLEYVETTCRVCDHASQGILIQCPDCGQLTFISDERSTDCNCKNDIDTKKLIKIIEDTLSYNANIQDGEEIDWIANCTSCDGDHSVIKISDELWFCAECFETFDKVSLCDWCNELYTGYREDTYLFGCGCNFCEGHVAHHKND